MKNSKYLISGIGPGPGGVGALMKNLEPVSRRYGFRVLANWNRLPARQLLRQHRYFRVAQVVALKMLTRAQFHFATNSIKDSKIIFLHPQTAGFRTLIKLAQKNELFLYVMDNSFFCIRSYNFHPSRKTECLKCIASTANIDAECTPFPVKMNRDRNLDFLEQLHGIADQITFLCQNENQEKLIKRHFGSDASCKVIGMDTGELSDWSPAELMQSENTADKSFILFHGSAVEPKGLDYFYRLAEKLPNRRFIVPSPKTQIGHRAIPQNIEFYDVTWSTGLRELTRTASLVMNPSMWSAPIEGALIKSLAYNRNVATVKTQYGYENEIPDDVGLLRLPENVNEAATKIEENLDAGDTSKSFLQPRIEWLERMKVLSQFESFIATL